MKLSTLLILFTYSSSFAQTNNYQNLLDTAIRGSLFVSSKPLKVTRLNQKEMWYYVENLKEYSNQKLDTIMFSQIIQNAKFTDTSLWTDKELPKSLLLNEQDEAVSKKYAVQKLGHSDEKLIKFYKKQVNKFNSEKTVDRNLYYFSRPVFDSSNTFAIVQCDNVHSYFGGGGRIILYQLQSDKWKEVGIIMNWRY